MTWEEFELMIIYSEFRTIMPEWVEASQNPEYERHLMDAYDRSLILNNPSEPEAY